LVVRRCAGAHLPSTRRSADWRVRHSGVAPEPYSRDAAFGRSRAQRKTITRPHSSHRYTGPAVRCSTNVSWEEPHCGHTAAGESDAMTTGRLQALCRRQRL